MNEGEVGGKGGRALVLWLGLSGASLLFQGGGNSIMVMGMSPGHPAMAWVVEMAGEGEVSGVGVR